MWNGMLQGKSMHEGAIMQGNKKLNEKRIHPTRTPATGFLIRISEAVAAESRPMTQGLISWDVK